MGKLNTACALTATSALVFYIFVIIPAQQDGLVGAPVWLALIVIPAFCGVVLPIPVALIVILRDWLRQRWQTAKDISGER